MATPVVSVAAGGIAVIEAPNGMPVTEAANLRGLGVTKVVGKAYGLPVKFVSETGGPVVPPVTYATLDLATVAAVTLSGGNLIATNTGTTSPDQGARVASASGKTSGKYYFEVTWPTVTSPISSNHGMGIGTLASTYISVGGNATVGVIVYKSGAIYANGANTSVGISAQPSSGTIIGVAVDLDNRKIWFNQAGVWNGNASYNPVTNVGGVTIPAGTMVPFLTFGGTGGTANNVMSINFGASTFVRAVPSGFAAGWPA